MKPLRVARHALLLAALGLAPLLAATATAAFEPLGIPVRVGGLKGCIVGSDGHGGEALYFNFNQTSGKLFLVQVNPDTGEARQFEPSEGPGAWAFIAGPDDCIYLGTWDGALVLRFDPRHPERKIEVVGKPAKTESYIWNYAVGRDRRLYGVTYPQAKLVRHDPRTGALEDLGRMHPTEMYARSVAAGPNGKIYVGIGTVTGDLVVYDPATGQHRSILPPGLHGAKDWSTVAVSTRADGQVYAEFGRHVFRLEDETPVAVTAAPPLPRLTLRDGREVTAFNRGSFTLRDPRTGRTEHRTFKYAGNGDPIFVVGPGPDGQIYGSTVLPLEIFRYDPRAERHEHLGGMPGGEVYSLLPHDGKLYLCYYGGAVMNRYDPAGPAWKYGPGADCNPITYGGVGDGHLRPRAMIHGPDGMIYVGSEPPYGQHGGAMAVWDPRTNRTIENYRHLISNQGIVSLAWDPVSGLIFGGSANWGGGGTKPIEKEAKFFAFDPRTKRRVFERALVPGAKSYPATFAADGLIYTTVADQFLVFDPKADRVIRTLPLPATQTEISLGQRRDGTLVGLTSRHVYLYDPRQGALTLTAPAPTPIRCGFALTDGAVYFGSGPTLWRYHLPALRQP